MDYQIADQQDYEIANEQYQKDTVNVPTIEEAIQLQEDLAKASNMFFGDRPSEAELDKMFEEIMKSYKEEKLTDHLMEMGEEGV